MNEENEMEEVENIKSIEYVVQLCALLNRLLKLSVFVF